MTAIRYIQDVPRLEGQKRRVLLNAEYNDRGDAIWEHWGDIRDEGPVDVVALEQLLDGAVWVGEGSPFALPAGWCRGVEFWVTGDRSFDGDQPVEVNKALAFVLQQQLPLYPSAHTVRTTLAGQQLAVVGERGDITHADVLVAIAAGREWTP